MMAESRSIQVKVADAVAEEIRHQSFTLKPTVRRRYLRAIALSDLGTLYVDVQPGVMTTKAVSREAIEYTCRVDVLIRKRFTTEEENDVTGEIETEEIDRLLLLLEEIHDFFHMRALEAYPDAVWEAIEFRPGYVPAHLHTMRQFTGIVAATFKVIE